MVEGLISSSVKNGSRTDMGLGRSVLSTGLSRSSIFLVCEELAGDTNGEENDRSSSNESCKRTRRKLHYNVMKHKGKRQLKPK